MHLFNSLNGGKETKFAARGLQQVWIPKCDEGGGVPDVCGESYRRGNARSNAYLPGMEYGCGVCAHSYTPSRNLIRFLHSRFAREFE